MLGGVVVWSPGAPALGGSRLGLDRRRRDARQAYRDGLLASRRRGARPSV